VFDNTLILFMSDNGGNAEGGPNGIARGPAELGRANSTVFCGESWAWMQNTPFRKFKHYNHEGGISSPLIAHWPKSIKPSAEWCREPAHLIDILPTCMELAGAKMPTTYCNSPTLPPEGVSLLPLLTEKPFERPHPIFWEHEGNAAVRQGNWKITRLGYAAPWELYDMQADRTEQNNLAPQNPEKTRQLAAKWDAWAQRANVKPWPEGIGYPRDPKKPSPLSKKSKRKKS
jgi:arylsulfatase